MVYGYKNKITRKCTVSVKWFHYIPIAEEIFYKYDTSSSNRARQLKKYE